MRLLRKPELLLLFILCLHLADRIYTFLTFAFVYTDNDQALLWTASKDLLKGEYHGLCFYGQQYNPLLEPLLSLPALWMGSEPWFALPVVTALLITLPFVAIILFSYRRYGVYAAMVPALLLLLLPPEFLMLTSIPRGFVGGIFFAVIGVLLFNYRSSVIALLFSGIFFGLALFANTNAVLLFPLVIPGLFADKTRALNRILLTFLGFLIGLFPMVYNHFYYQARPELLIHNSPIMRLEWNTFSFVIKKLDIYFDMVSPVFWRGGWITLVMLIAVGVYLYRRGKKAEGITVFVLLSAIIVSFSMNKVGESTNSVFFSGARMYLAYPYLLAVILTWFYLALNPGKRSVMINTLLILGITAFGIRMSFGKFFLAENMKGSKYTVVKVEERQKLKAHCEDMKMFAGANTSVMLSNSDNAADQLINYACPCLVDGFPQTVQPLYERRGWVLKEISTQKPGQVMVYQVNDSLRNHYHKAGISIINQHAEKGWILVKNTRILADLWKQKGIYPYKRLR